MFTCCSRKNKRIAEISKANSEGADTEADEKWLLTGLDDFLNSFKSARVKLRRKICKRVINLEVPAKGEHGL